MIASLSVTACRTAAAVAATAAAAAALSVNHSIISGRASALPRPG